MHLDCGRWVACNVFGEHNVRLDASLDAGPVPRRRTGRLQCRASGISGPRCPSQPGHALDVFLPLGFKCFCILLGLQRLLALLCELGFLFVLSLLFVQFALVVQPFFLCGQFFKLGCFLRLQQLFFGQFVLGHSPFFALQHDFGVGRLRRGLLWGLRRSHARAGG